METAKRQNLPIGQICLRQVHAGYMVTLRLDADVIAWLHKQGKGYQTRANALLRAAMLRDLHQKAS